MKNTITNNALIGSAILTLAFVAFLGAFPNQAQANFFYTDGIGPFGPYYDRYCPPPQIATVAANGFYTCSYPTAPAVVTPPIYQPPVTPSLTASCYPVNSSSVPAGSSITWAANASGGNGMYSYSWTGTDGLSGGNQSISMVYGTPGIKTASVTVYSGGQSMTANCSGSVNVYGQNYSYNYYGNYNYNTSYVQPLTAACSASVNATGLGNSVVWNAQASGGNGYYQYSWNGTDALSGVGQSLHYSYNQPGLKYASVTVYSNGQTITQPCSNTASVGMGMIGGPVGPRTGELDIACYADPGTADINQPINWIAEVVGGSGSYNYSWTGTDGLSSSGKSAIKYYASRGVKTAVVSVTSSDGRTGTHACSVNIASRTAPTTVVTTTASPQTVAPTTSANQNNLGAAALFSLGNVPWGWVAILVILILFAMVMYLLFNRTKI